MPCLLFAACIESLGSRRKVITAVMAGLGAEAAWRRAVAAAETAIEAVPATSILPPGTIEQIQAGRAVVVNNWLPPEETAALRADQIACLEAGHFKEFVSNIHRRRRSSNPNPNPNPNLNPNPNPNPNPDPDPDPDPNPNPKP